MITTRVCRVCKTEKPLEELVACKKSKHGRRKLCVNCATKRSAYYWNHIRTAEDKRKRSIRHYRRQIEKNEGFVSCGEKECKSCLKIKSRGAFRLKRGQKDGLDTSCKICRNTQDRSRGRDYNSILRRVRRRVTLFVQKKYKGVSITKLIGCSNDELRSYLEMKFQPGMSWENYGFYCWHIDHIIPLSSFDLTDPNQLSKAIHYTNLQPLWAGDNLSKSDKVPNHEVSQT